MVSGVSRDTQELTSRAQYLESEVRSRGTLKISREGNLKIIPRLVRTGEHRYQNVQLYEYEVREEKVIDQKGTNMDQDRVEFC